MDIIYYHVIQLWSNIFECRDLKQLYFNVILTSRALWKTKWCWSKFSRRATDLQIWLIRTFVSALTVGDPHFTSLDGYKYSFNGIGEFVYLRTADKSFQSQIRFEQFRKANGIKNWQKSFSLNLKMYPDKTSLRIFFFFLRWTLGSKCLHILCIPTSQSIRRRRDPSRLCQYCWSAC